MIMILTGGARGEHPLFVSLENRESIGRKFFVFEADENLEKWCAPQRHVDVPHIDKSVWGTSIL